MIVCGLRGVGQRVVEQLRAAGSAVVVIDDDPGPELTAALAELGVPRLAPGPRLQETLAAAGLDGAAAVACVQHDDLKVLDTALLLRELGASARIIVGLDNPAVGRGVEGVSGIDSVLDVAGLFAPSVIETCTRRDAHRLDIGGEPFMVAEGRITAGGSLRSLFGDLVPIAVAAEGSDLQVCPGRDEQVGHGDRVWLLGTEAELVAAGLGGGSRPNGRRRGEHLDTLTGALGFLIDRRERGLRTMVAAVVLLIAMSTLVLALGYRPRGHSGHLSLLDALYFTVETISTVGFGDFSFSGQAGWLEAFGVLLIVLGALVLTTLFGLITNALVRRRLDQSLGRARVAGISDHVVLVGLGAVGMRVLDGLLAQRRQVVVIERDEANPYLAEARALGVRAVVGDATLHTTLELANLRAASAVAILTSDDLTNIEAGLAVRDALRDSWSQVPVVLRVFDRSLGQRVQHSFGFHHVWSTSAIAAPWFIGAALGLEVLATFYADQEPFLLASLTVAPSGGLAGVAMRELSARMRVIAIRRAGSSELEHPPRRETRFAPGDEAFLVGPSEELLKVLGREQSSGALLRP